MDFFNSIDDKANDPNDDDDIFIDLVEQDESVEDDPFTPDDDDDLFVDAVEQDESIEDDLEYDNLLDKFIKEREAKIENQRFNSVPGHGKQANAYRHDLDNLKIKEMREKGYSLQKIADMFTCSRSTIRNRLKQLVI